MRDRLDTFAPHPLPLDEALSLLSQIGDGLQYAHEHRIVHRDLKPENILFNTKGEALLADFGIAIVLSSGTQQGESIGTLVYMAPEQLQGVSSQKSDQYALGCIAYEMVTGHLPFPGPDREAFIYQQMYQRPLSPQHLNPDLPVSVEQAILRALAKDRNARYPDIPTFLAALQSPSVPPLLFATSEPPHTIRIPSRISSSFSAPPRALRQQEDDLFEQPIVKRNHIIPQVPSSRSRNHSPRVRVASPVPSSRSRDHSPQIRVARTRVRIPEREEKPPRQVPPRRQQDWRIILTCFFGLGGIIGGSVLLASPQNFPLPFHILFVIVAMICVVVLLMGIVQAIAESYQTKAWKWFALLIAGPVVAGLLGLIFGSGIGLSTSFVLGLLVTTLLSILYGWQHPPQKKWVCTTWFFPTNNRVVQSRRRHDI